MEPRSTELFRTYLLERHSALPRSDRSVSGQSLRELWEASNVPASEFADEVARYWDVRRLGLPELLASTPCLDGFSRRFLRESMLFPMVRADGSHQVAIADPSDKAAIRATEIVLGGDLELCVASFEDIATVLDQRIDADEAASIEKNKTSERSDDDIESLRDLASGAPVVRALNDLFERAVDLRASDIHIETFRSGLTVRMRVDGLLRAVQAPASISSPALISRVKILAGLNIAERRLPQDGAARVRVSRAELDVRVATMPTQAGESAVIRLLPRDRGLLEMGKLGLSSRDEKIISRLLALPHGMIVITGPTGSGKTTTLATMLSILNEPTRKILTIEDPVEYEIPGINQSQVKPSIGLTFATAMRSFVRQDPDVIMVGEIRDAETAHIAIQAALTGHLVLTTLHTRDAPSALGRLIDMGIEPFLVSSAVDCIVAQRLVRLLCKHCKKPQKVSAAVLEEHGLSGAEPFEAVGCSRCGGSGYRGRMGVYEVMSVSEHIRALILERASVDDIAAAAMG